MNNGQCIWALCNFRTLCIAKSSYFNLLRKCTNRDRKRIPIALVQGIFVAASDVSYAISYLWNLISSQVNWNLNYGNYSLCSEHLNSIQKKWSDGFPSFQSSNRRISLLGMPFDLAIRCILFKKKIQYSWKLIPSYFQLELPSKTTQNGSYIPNIISK